MSLRPEEIDRCKYELGVPLTRIGAEPYITYVALFDRAIQPYLFDNATTSSTVVTAGSTQAVTLATNPAAPNGVGLTFNVGTLCLVDIGPLQEQCVIQAISGLSATMTFTNAHGAVVPYPISPVGSEQIVRDILARLDTIRVQMQSVAPMVAGVDTVDEAKLVPSGKGRGGKTLDKFQSLVMQRSQARDDLGQALGCGNFNRAGRASTSVSIY